MDDNFDKNQPIYQQIIDRFINSIARGALPPGAKIRPVRELAMEFKVNPNTMQRSLAKLEELGYLRTERTSGRFVTEDADFIQAARARIPEKITAEFVKEMTDFGMQLRDIPDYTRNFIERTESSGKNIGN